MARKRSNTDPVYRAWYERNRVKISKQTRAWKQANPEKVKAARDRWQARNKTKIRDHSLRHKFGITLDQYDALRRAQRGQCAACLRPAGDETLCVDHDHETREIRGLVHRRCNMLIGQIERFGGDVNRVIRYIKQGGYSGRKQVSVPRVSHRRNARLRRLNWRR